MHKYSLRLLSSMIESQNVPHALLFSGPDSNEKKAAALSFAKYLLRADRNEFINHRLEPPTSPVFYPDLYILDAPSLKIGEVRKLREKFALAPFSAKSKVAVIQNAEELSKESANAMLKTIEEPRADSFFIFLAKSKKALLPTIASRTFEIRFAAEGVPPQSDISDKVRDFEALPLYKKFSVIQNYNLDNKSELLGFLDAWLINLRRDILSGKDTKKAAIVRDILSLKRVISTTNSNPQILMEQLCVTHYL